MKASTKETIKDLVAEMTKARYDFKVARNVDNSVNMNDEATKEIVLIELNKKINYVKENLITALQNKKYASNQEEFEIEKLKCSVEKSKLEMLESAFQDFK